MEKLTPEVVSSYRNFFNLEMAYFRSYWFHLEISTTICPHQMAAERFELTTLEFRGMALTHCAIGADLQFLYVKYVK